MSEVVLKIRNEAVSRFDLQKGEAIEYVRGDRNPRSADKVPTGLVIACPRCGYPASGPHKWDQKSKSLTPSLICGSEGCGYHGHLKNGIFDKV